MKKIGLLCSVLYLTSSYSQVWINEISYQMTGADNDDFIEIVAPVNTDMSTYGILLANGNGNVSYNYVQLSGTVSNTNSNNGFGFFILLTNQSGDVVVPVSVTSQSSGFGSIQNGSPDGVLLLNHTTAATIHGIWYAESSTAPTEITRNGTGSPPGTGPYSMIDVDVTSLGDLGNTASKGSISMSGTGNSGTWEVTLSGTPGDLNTNQSNLPVELSSFSAVIVNSGIKLNWRTETEVNNYGFDVERQVGSRQSTVGNWEMIGFVEGHGNSNSPKEYSFIDDNILSGKYAYRLKQIDNDGTYEFSKVIEIDVDAPLGYELSQNYPNPFNPTTTIKFSLPEAANVKLSLYNIIGETVALLVNEFKEAGVHTINFNASDLNSGIYFYKLEADNFVKIRKMSLIK